MNKKGVSGVITVILLIALTLVLVAVVWTVINNIVTKNIEESEACSFIFDKVFLNSQYTCYNSTSGEFLFSIGVQDLDVESILVSIIVDGESTVLELSDDINTQITGYGSGDTLIPGKDSGKTYIWSSNNKPSSVKVAPKVNKIQCDISDSIVEIINC